MAPSFSRSPEHADHCLTTASGYARANWRGGVPREHPSSQLTGKQQEAPPLFMPMMSHVTKGVGCDWTKLIRPLPIACALTGD